MELVLRGLMSFFMHTYGIIGYIMYFSLLNVLECVTCTACTYICTWLYSR